MPNDIYHEPNNTSSAFLPTITNPEDKQDEQVDYQIQNCMIMIRDHVSQVGVMMDINTFRGQDTLQTYFFCKVRSKLMAELPGNRKLSCAHRFLGAQLAEW